MNDVNLLLNVLNRVNALGFDRTFKTLTPFVNEKKVSYPPHDIYKVSQSETVIEVAVAGINKKDIEIHLNDQILSISYSGKGAGDEEGNDCQDADLPVTYIHRGISRKAFDLKFMLSDHMEVQEAQLDEGVLRVRLKELIPEEKMPRVITIN